MAQITNRAAILSFFDFEIPVDLLEKVIIDNGVLDEQVYLGSSIEKVEAAVIDVCGSLMTLDSFGESGLSMKYNRKALKDLRVSLITKWGLEDSKGFGLGSISSRKIW